MYVHAVKYNTFHKALYHDSSFTRLNRIVFKLLKCISEYVCVCVFLCVCVCVCMCVCVSHWRKGLPEGSVRDGHRSVWQIWLLRAHQTQQNKQSLGFLHSPAQHCAHPPSLNETERKEETKTHCITLCIIAVLSVQIHTTILIECDCFRMHVCYITDVVCVMSLIGHLYNPLHFDLQNSPQLT